MRNGVCKTKPSCLPDDDLWELRIFMDNFATPIPARTRVIFINEVVCRYMLFAT